MPRSDKALKQEFVSNLTGSSIWDINSVTLVAPMAILLWSTLQARQSFFTPYSTAAGLTDFLLNCGAILLATTLYSSAPLLLNALFFLPAIIMLVTSYLSDPGPARGPGKTKLRNAPKNAPKEQRQSLPVKPFVTHYRGAMMVVTCIAILAVDFHVFPRRFAKAETWGTSLMDMGVGSFVFSGGVVSARGILRDREGSKALSLGTRLVASLRHSLPLLVLGFIRMWSVKGLDYAEHVTEYGVHWNFFFTLGLLPPFVALFQSFFNLIPSYAALSLILGVVYQIALHSTELETFILSGPRTNLFNKNREGIFSFFGYLAIFLSGQATGLYVLPAGPPASRQNRSLFAELRKSTFGQLAAWSIVWSALFILSVAYNGFGLEVSRRLANLPYILWVSAFNCTQIALFCGIEALLFPEVHHVTEKGIKAEKIKEATSKLMNAFNRNGLAIFLVANLLTGLVNLTVPTLRVGNMQAVGILVVYIGSVAALALGLDHYNVSIKL